MLTNPDHQVIKRLAYEMLCALDHCPNGLNKVCNDLLPIARFENGLYTPNSRPPTTVYVELDGVLWRHTKTGKKWIRA